MGTRRLTAEQVADARRRCARREATYPQLAAEMNVSVATIKNAVTGRSWAHIADPLPVRRGSPYRIAPRADGRRTVDSQRTRERLRELWVTTMTGQEIARAIGRDQWWVSRTARALGLPSRRPKRLPAEPRRRGPQGNAEARRRLPALYADRSLTIPQIAAQLGVHPITVSKWAAKDGLPKRRP